MRFLIDDSLAAKRAKTMNGIIYKALAIVEIHVSPHNNIFDFLVIASNRKLPIHSYNAAAQLTYPVRE